MAWFNLALAANASLLILFVWGTMQSRGMMTYVAIDYRTFRSTGAIARDHGYQFVYDESLLDAYQRPQVEAFATTLGQAEYVPITAPYIPAFLPAFGLILLFSPLEGFLIWTLVSILAMILAFRPSLERYPLKGRTTIWIAALLSLPVVLTLLFGQINALLCLGLAGYLISMRRGQDFRAGIWLSLLLIKPQALVILAPGLLLGRQFRAALGLGVASFSLLALSFALSGQEGLSALASLYLRYPGDLPHTFPEGMMNWRAVATQVGLALGRPGADWAAAAASVLTVILGLVLWVRLGEKRDEKDLAIVVLVSYAATSLAAWHAHVHMAAPLLVPLLYLVALLPWRAYFIIWVLLPTVVFSLAGILLGPGPAHRATALVMVGLNAAGFWLGWRQITPRRATWF